MNTKLHLKDKKTCPIMRDQKGNEAIKKAKRQFEYKIKEMKKRKEYPLEKQSGAVDSYYLKTLKKKHQTLEENIINEQLRYYLTLRDKKIAYIRHIHGLMEKL
eukprot:GHVR01068050.1.p1 GENE.GHVR01068050.1~~GHVR01068050.1.p1  ORF type:complete len:103 (+),score=13.28 GHVR01068050.1:3887-4195(+)